MIFAQINAAQQQKFKATPHDLQVLEGSEAVLRCEVSNLAGQVQWTKDGFALGKFNFFVFFFSWNVTSYYMHRGWGRIVFEAFLKTILYSVQ